MKRALRSGKTQNDEGLRFALGLQVGSGCRRLGAALVSAEGRGLDARVAVRATSHVDVPDETARLYRQLACPATAGASAEAIIQLRMELAEIQSRSVAELLPAAVGAGEGLLIVGVDDPGLWATVSGQASGQIGLCDAARLAELTGENIIDALPARDLALGGQGGPILALPQWILLSAPDETRLVVDLGRTTRMSLLPARCEPSATGRLLSFDVGPGMELLDALARQLTNQARAFDAGGHLAVQGRRIDALLEHWLADPLFERPLPRWHPRGVRVERFLNEAIQMALERDWSVRDLLCTATHLVAESIARAVRCRLPGDLSVGRVVLTGGGCQNGMLLAELAARLPEIPLTPTEEMGIPDGALGPACVAVLAICHVDQLPGNPPGVTGAGAPRVLGRLTPGSPQNWRRLVGQMASVPPALRTLRSAI